MNTMTRFFLVPRQSPAKSATVGLAGTRGAVARRRLALCAAPLMLMWGLAAAPARAQDATGPLQAPTPIEEKLSGAVKPPLVPDTVAPFTTDSRISATIEFGLPALASDIEKDIPRRLASIDERVSCVHRRVLFFRVNANCDI